MSFYLIKGTFHVVPYSPDGDSARFKADNKGNWKLLSGPAVEWNARDHVQLRFEAIDALETHYGGHHQPKELALAAREELIAKLGIKDVEWNEKQTKVISAKDGTKGFILARVVESHRRPVAFVFAGGIKKKDGAEIRLDQEMVKKSVNYHLIKEGLAFPTYYTGLFPDLRDEFTVAVQKAREEKNGIWAQDKTNTGVILKDLEGVSNHDVILPKLFRRIVAFMGHGGQIDKFKEYLKEQNDQLTILPETHFTRLDVIVEIEGDKVRLTKKPEELVFLEK